MSQERRGKEVIAASQLEVDFILPEGWAIGTLEDLVSSDGVLVDGDWIESKDQDPQGGIRLIQLADIGDGFFKNKSLRFLTSEKAKELVCTFLKPGDVLIARMPEPLGRACIFPGDPKRAVTAVDICIMRTGKYGGDHRWIMHLINSPEIRKRIEELQKGTTRKRITRRNLISIKLPIAPLAEQKRSVEKVEELLVRVNAARERLAKVQATLKRFRQAILSAACSGRLTADWRNNQEELEAFDDHLEKILAKRRSEWESKQLAKMRSVNKIPKDNKWKLKYKDPISPLADQFPKLPVGWFWATIEQLASTRPGSIQSGPFGSNLHHSEFQEIGILAIGIDNVLDGKFTMGREHRISQDKYQELKKYTARPLDVLITVMATIGRCCVIPEWIETAIITKHVYRITVDPTLIEPHYLMSALRGDMDVQRQIQSQIRGQTRPGINGQILKAIAIPIPPISEQQEIVRRVEALFKLAESIENRVATSTVRVDKLLQAILAKAFRGELVPTEAELARREGRSYEPASALLARIKAEWQSKRESKVPALKRGRLRVM